MGSLSNSQVSAEPVAAEYGQTKFHVVVVGAGLGTRSWLLLAMRARQSPIPKDILRLTYRSPGGLSAAISCLREGLEVTILEKAKEFTDVGSPPQSRTFVDLHG